MADFVLRVYTFGRTGQYHWRGEIAGKTLPVGVDVIGSATAEFLGSLGPNSVHLATKAGMSVGDMVSAFMSPAEVVSAGMSMFSDVDTYPEFADGCLYVDVEGAVAEN